MRLIQGTWFGNGASVLRSRAPPLSWKRTVSTPWHFSRLEGAWGDPDSGTRLKTASPTPEAPGEKRFQSGPEGGEASGRFQVQTPPPQGTLAPRRLANFPRPGCPGRTSPLPFFFFLNNFALGRHDLHSPARRSEPRNKGELKPHNSSAARRQRFAALRGGSHPAAMFPTREPPQNQPPSPLRPALRPPSRPGRGRGASELLSTLPRRPLAAKSDSTAAGCAPARSAGSGRGRPVRSRPRLEKAGATGRGGGGGRSGPEPPLSSQRAPAPAPARLSHVHAKNPLQSLVLGAGAAPSRSALGPSRGPRTEPRALPALPKPWRGDETGRPESGDAR